MKVIINESQLKEVILLEYQERMLFESFLSSKNLEDLKMKIKKALVGGVAVISVLAAIHDLNIRKSEKEYLENIVKMEVEQLHKADSVFNEKVEACKKYMEWALSNQGYSFKSTDLRPETLVKAAEESGFDLPFLIAVAHQESCFGATPRAKKTNSVFSVGSYDDGSNVVNYSDPNESVIDYINLIKRDYMINGKTINDLMIPNNFVNKNGDRYAQDKKYENKIKYLRDLIIKNFPELR
jgi:hypothetical protein